MTIRNDDEWQDLEDRAYAAEHADLDKIETIPVPPPTVEQQLAFAVTRCADLQSRLIMLKGRAAEAHMWLSLGDTQRTQEALNRLICEL